MSCLSRIFGLLFSLIPGLGSLFFSVLLIGKWPELGWSKGAFYSVLSAITGWVCLYLGIAILFARGHAPTANSPALTAPAAVDNANPLSISAASQSLFATTETALDSPEARIRQVAQARPGLQVSAPELAQLANLDVGVAEATARLMARNGENIELRAGERGETVYVFR